jgi:hypothetical protein
MLLASRQGRVFADLQHSKPGISEAVLFWVMIPCIVIGGYKIFGGVCCFYL